MGKKDKDKKESGKAKISKFIPKLITKRMTVKLKPDGSQGTFIRGFE